VARELGVKVFSSLEDVKKEVQAVTLAVSTKAHFEVAQFFIENGISVNVEKPMTSTLAEAEALAKLVDKMNGNLSVGHIERFNPSVLELKRLLENPIHFEFKRLGPFRARGADVNVLYDLMIHDMDLALWLTGSEPESLIASGSRLIEFRMGYLSGCPQDEKWNAGFNRGFQSLPNASEIDQGDPSAFSAECKYGHS
jgi:predicted dehydrogenase